MSGTYAVLERHLLYFKRTWHASVFSSFILPILFVVSIGLGVGGYISNIRGFDYLSWIVPGVLASSAFQMAIGDSTYPIMGDFKWSRSYHAMRATPIRIWDMIAGFQWWVQFRVFLAAIVFLFVCTAFGAIHSPWVLVTPFIVGLMAAAVSAPVMAFSATIENDSYFALLFRFAVIPSTLFAGVFFPVDQVPIVLRPLAYASPLWHGVELCRAATLGAAPPWPIWVHVGYLAVWAAGGMWLATRAFNKRLKD